MMYNISIMYIMSEFSTESMYIASKACDCTVLSRKGQNIVHIPLIHRLYKVGLTLIYNNV